MRDRRREEEKKRKREKKKKRCRERNKNKTKTTDGPSAMATFPGSFSSTNIANLNLNLNLNPQHKKKGPSTRRALSCLPCRRHKLKCDRHVPCHSCTRYRREDLCRKHPAPSSVLESSSFLPKPNAASMPPAHPSPPVHISPYAETSTTSYLPPVSSSNSTTSTSATTTSTTTTTTTTTLAGTSVLSGSLPFLVSAGQPPVRQAEVATFWKVQLTSFLPAQHHCDYLVQYYLDHLNWVHHPLHAPSFRAAYAAFWNTNVEDVSLLWLALLFTVLSCSAIYLPFHTARTAGLDPATIRLRAHQWHSASRQALDAGNYESRPSLIQIETFLATQLYWLATKNIEAMNSYVVLIMERRERRD